MAEQIIVSLMQARTDAFDALKREESELFIKLAQKRCSLLRELLETE